MSNEEECVCSAPKLRNGAAVGQLASLSFRRNFGHHARPIWRRLIISYGDMKGSVYQNKPRTIDTLKPNIAKEIQAVTADVLARTFQNMACRVQSCLDANGGHLQQMV